MAQSFLISKTDLKYIITIICDKKPKFTYKLKDYLRYLIKGIINAIVTFCLVRFGEYTIDKEVMTAAAVGKIKYGSYADKSFIHKNDYVWSWVYTYGKFVKYLNDKNHVIRIGTCSKFTNGIKASTPFYFLT